MWGVAAETELHDYVLEFFAGDFFRGLDQLALVFGGDRVHIGDFRIGMLIIEVFCVEFVKPFGFFQFSVVRAFAFPLWAGATGEFCVMFCFFDGRGG